MVGIVDGVRAALIVGVDGRDVLVAALLAASVDAVLGLVAATAIFGLARAASWGRRGPIATTRWGPALMLAGAATIGVTVAVFAATLDRRNRFLAGGLTAMATLAAAVIMVVLLIYRPATTWPGFVIVLLGIPVFALLRRRAPQRSSSR